MDASNGTHRCRCGGQWTQAMAPTDVVVGYTYIFMIFECSSHNRSSSGQRSIYSARSSSSTSRNNNRTKSTWTLGGSLACLRIYPTSAMKLLALPSSATTSAPVIAPQSWHALPLHNTPVTIAGAQCHLPPNTLPCRTCLLIAAETNPGLKHELGPQGHEPSVRARRSRYGRPMQGAARPAGSQAMRDLTGKPLPGMAPDKRGTEMVPDKTSTALSFGHVRQHAGW